MVKKSKNVPQNGAQVAKMKDNMREFRQGVEAGYMLAIEDLRTALEHKLISRKNQDGIAYLTELSIDCADRWLEDSGEDVSNC